jgi:PBSX family phage terminase large subunit
MEIEKTNVDINEPYLPAFLGGKRYYLICGGRAGGRSYFASQVATTKLFSKSYFRCGIMRYVLGDIRNSIFKEILDRINDYDLTNEKDLEISEHSLTINFKQNMINGIGFRKSSGDQKAKLKSLAGYTDIIIEEAEEVSEEDFLQLDDSLRTIKADVNIYLLFNMPPKDHWINKRWFNLIECGIEGFYRAELKESEKHNTMFIHTTYKDNELHLNPTTIDNYLRYKETNPEHFYNIILGLVPSGKTGVIFKNWKPISDEEYNKLEYDTYLGQDFGFSCLGGNTLISTNNGEVKMKDLKIGDLVYTRNGYKKITSFVNTGIKQVYRLNFGYDRNIIITGEHKVLTSQGWKQVKNLGKKETICIKKLSNSKEIPEKDLFHQHILNENPVLTNVHINLQLLKEKREVFDISVEDENEFFANGILVHNCDPLALVEIKQHNNKIYLKELLYETGLTNKRLAERYETLGLSRSMPIYADSAEPKAIQELRDYDWNVIPAIKGQDSISAGINYLQDFEVYYTESSVNLAREIQNYCWAVDKNKVPTDKPVDKENHCCFTKDTKIENPFGNIIKQVSTGLKDIYEFMGSKVTADHPYLTQRGFVRLDCLRYSDRIIVWKNKLLMGLLLDDTQNLKGVQIGSILHLLKRNLQAIKQNAYTGIYGKNIMEKYLRVFIYTIKTTIHLTTVYLTSNFYHQKNIVWKTMINVFHCGEKILRQLLLKLLNGQRQQRVKNLDTNVESIIQNIFQDIESQETVINVEKNILQKHSLESSATIIVKLKHLGKEEVFATATDNGFFLANGVLVSNCDAIRYGTYTHNHQEQFSII